MGHPYSALNNTTGTTWPASAQYGPSDELLKVLDSNSNPIEQRTYNSMLQVTNKDGYLYYYPASGETQGQTARFREDRRIHRLSYSMPRMARVIAEGVAHHVTQRGNGRRVVFDSDADQVVYLYLLRQYSVLHRCALAGYCLMSNHVHLIAVPSRADSLPLVLRDVHGRYATYLNGRQSTSGHVWQGRYFSCPLDAQHLWAALRYVERNPVRAGMVERAEEYAWSSAAAHCGGSDRHGLLDLDFWRGEWSVASWRMFLEDAAETDEERIRRNTHTGRPLGSGDFVKQMERRLGRTLAPQKGGRPRKQSLDETQQLLDFARTE